MAKHQMLHAPFWQQWNQFKKRPIYSNGWCANQGWTRAPFTNYQLDCSLLLLYDLNHGPLGQHPVR